jgi:hypothetical protein
MLQMADVGSINPGVAKNSISLILVLNTVHLQLSDRGAKFWALPPRLDSPSCLNTTGSFSRVCLLWPLMRSSARCSSGK